jgi:putative SOS response-associated peptidase YedK
MCFYFGLPDSATVVMKRFQKPFKQPELFVASDKYNGFAHPMTPIITSDAQEHITFGSWGLLPQWSQDVAFRKNTLNARIETIESLPSFRDYTNNRCLIPASCFFEWRHEGKTKVPFRIMSIENDIFTFAGLYSDWQHPDTKEVLRTYTIITTAANDTMQYIHNTKQRMPVILHQADEQNWLDGTAITQFAFPYSVGLKVVELS